MNNLISDCGTPVVWGELVPSKIFNPSALTLKVGQLAMCYYNITSDGFYFMFTLKLISFLFFYIRIIFQYFSLKLVFYFINLESIFSPGVI